MPLPALPPIDTEEWAAYRVTRLRRASSRALVERARAIPPPRPPIVQPRPVALPPSYRGPEVPPPPEAPVAPAPRGPLPADLVPSQLGSKELSTAEAMAACGPAAAVAFARHNGRNPTLREAVDMAKSVGWTSAQGMAGPASQQKLLEKMGVAARLEQGVDWAKVRADVEGGNPVTISTPKHYFVATGYDPETDKFDFQASGEVLRGGARHLRPADVQRLGGGLQGALYLDNPSPGTAPSLAVTAPAPATAPAVNPAAGEAEIESYVRQAAAARGIDPDIAVRAAHTEGGVKEPARRGTFKTGSSWWPFQLHYGGKGTPYENLGTTAGMGNSFTKETGWEPGDPAAWRASIDYALDGVAKNGWGAWYGPKKLGITGRTGVAKDARPLGVDPANLPGAPPATPQAAQALPAEELPPTQPAHQRTYASPHEQIADIVSRYRAEQMPPALQPELEAGEVPAVPPSPQEQIADIVARYRQRAPAAPAAPALDYQAQADVMVAEAARRRAAERVAREQAAAEAAAREQAAREAAAAWAAEEAAARVPAPPVPVVEGVPLRDLESYDQPFRPPPEYEPYEPPPAPEPITVPPPAPALPPPEYEPTWAEQREAAFAVPEPPPPAPAPEPEPANPFERVGRALVDALRGVPDLAAQAGAEAAVVGESLGPASPGEIAGTVGRVTETPRAVAGGALEVARAVTPTSIAARSVAGEEQIAAESRPHYEALQGAIETYGPDSPEAEAAAQAYNAQTAALRAEGVYAAAERNPSLVPAELAAGIAGSALAGVVAPSASAGVARNIAATALDPTQGLVNVAGPAARAAGRAAASVVPPVPAPVAAAVPPAPVTREAFEEAVAPLLRTTEPSYAITLPTPEIPVPSLRAPRPAPVPPSPTPGSPGATALDTILRPPGGEPSPSGADRLDSARMTFMRQFFDDRIDLKVAQQQVEQAYGGELPPALRAVELDRLTNGSDMAARLRVERELEPAYARAGRDSAALKAYLEAQDNIDKAAAIGQRAGAEAGEARRFSGGINVAESRAAVDDLRARLGPERFAAVEDAANGIYDYVGRLRTRLVDAGVWSRELADQLASQYPHYMPTRILDYMDDAAPRFGAGQKLGLSDQGLKRLTIAGTEREREDITASLSRLAFEVERRARKNEAARAVYAWRDIDPDLAQIMREVKPGAKHAKDEVPLYFFENGAKREVLVDKAFEPVISFQSVGGQNLAQKLGALPAQIVRETATGRNPLFALAGNPLLDLPTYLFRESAQYGVHRLPRIAVELARSYGDTFAGLTTGDIAGPGLQRFLAGGGGQFGYFGGSQKEAAELATQIERRALGRVVGSRADLMRVAKDVGTFGWVPKVGFRAENAPRVAAMRLAERYGADPQAAVMAGRTVTQDFTQGGLFTKTMNQYIPFFNIAAQSPYWLAQTVRKNPKGALAAVTAIAVAPAIVTEAWNRSDPERAKAYDDVPDYIKNRGIVAIAPPQLGGPWLAPDKDGRVRPNYLFIPMRNLAPFTLLAREAAGRAMGDASPQDWQSVLLGIVGASSPVSTESAEGAFSSFVPAIFGPGIQLAFNRDVFRGRAIVSDIADEQATLGSQRIAEGLQKIGIKNARPSAVEFVLREAGNGIAGMALAAVDTAEKVRTGEPITGPNPALRDLPAVGGLIGRFLPAYGGQKDADLRTLRDQTRDQLIEERRRQIEGYDQLPDKTRDKIESDASQTATALVYGTERQPNTMIRNLRTALEAAGHDPAEISQRLADLRQQLRTAAEQAEPSRRAVLGSGGRTGGA